MNETEKRFEKWNLFIMAANYLAFSFRPSWIFLTSHTPAPLSSFSAFLSASHHLAFRAAFGSTEHPCVTVLNYFNSDLPLSWIRLKLSHWHRYDVNLWHVQCGFFGLEYNYIIPWIRQWKVLMRNLCFIFLFNCILSFFIIYRGSKLLEPVLLNYTYHHPLINSCFIYSTSTRYQVLFLTLFLTSKIPPVELGFKWRNLWSIVSTPLRVYIGLYACK